MFQPNFKISNKLANQLLRIEGVRLSIASLPITPSVLAALRETARLYSTHYSTMIEGNRLTQEEVIDTIQQGQHFPGRDRDEKEVLGYYVALDFVEKLATNRKKITEKDLQMIHALVMAGGQKRVKPTPYRDGQNVIRETGSRKIVYMPPEATDVSILMQALIKWLSSAENEEIPYPLKAGIAHYQYATIHPYYDGNGRTARLLATLVLHLGGYDLKGLYSLEEYYAMNLAAYYQALSIGPSHNYYLGRAEADVTQWLEYFCEGMAESFERVKAQAEKASNIGVIDKSEMLRKLDARQRKLLILFESSNLIDTTMVAKLFNVQPRTARVLCQRWVEDGFLVIANPAYKNRKYALNDR